MFLSYTMHSSRWWPPSCRSASLAATSDRRHRYHGVGTKWATYTTFRVERVQFSKRRYVCTLILAHRQAWVVGALTLRDCTRFQIHAMGRVCSYFRSIRGCLGLVLILDHTYFLIYIFRLDVMAFLTDNNMHLLFFLPNQPQRKNRLEYICSHFSYDASLNSEIIV